MVSRPVTSSAVSAASRSSCDDSTLWEIAAAVPDPEVPVLTIEDLGVLRAVDEDEHGHVTVTITPTYSGCPAMDTIRADVLSALAAAGHTDAEVVLTLSPAWTTEWMSDEGKRKLLEYGIAPPGGLGRLDQRGSGPVSLTLSLRCPQCGSPDTRELSRFGSTACKSLWVCNACREPFDHFKAI
ncbi:MAG: 1,2-phenylacetyl-CoA epoxidase subunit PaaD [Actinomycetes bacterium]